MYSNTKKQPICMYRKTQCPFTNPLSPPMASILTKKIMQGFFDQQSFLSILAPSPTNFCTSSEPITQMKQESVRLATAVGFSPSKRSTPSGGSIPSFTNCSGCVCACIMYATMTCLFNQHLKLVSHNAYTQLPTLQHDHLLMVHT